MKIALTGVTGFRNRGVEALVVTTIEQFLKRVPEAEIIVATWSPEYDQERFPHPQVTYVYDSFLENGKWVLNYNFQIIKEPLLRRIIRYGLIIFKIRKEKPVNRFKYQMPFEDVDLVVVSGGDLFSSVYGASSLMHSAEPVFWAKERGIVCAMIGQTIGEFSNSTDKDIWTEIEQSADFITLRDTVSLDYLKNDFPSSTFPYFCSVDSAFLLEYSNLIGIQKKEMLKKSYVAISVSYSMALYTNSERNRRFEIWIEIIQMILNEWNQNVVLITHVQEKYSDDRVIASQLWRSLNFDSRVNVCGEDLSASEFKSIISNSELVIAERMHAAIAGFSSGVCTIPVSYSIKSQGLAQVVFDDSKVISYKDVVLTEQDFENSNLLKEKIANIWIKRELIGRDIQERLPKLQSKASESFDFIYNMVKYNN
ncbi:MAG: polysaccharide pyruvyl transferase family protein [Bacteroidales bacterium]